MSVAIEFRNFLRQFPTAVQPLTQIAQGRIPEDYDEEKGYIWFALRSTAGERTLDPVEVDGDGVPTPRIPDELFFDLEIYHPDLSVTEKVANLLHSFDTYGGTFGNGSIGVMFVDNQSDDYTARVETDDSVDLEYSFLSVELRLFKEPIT